MKGVILAGGLGTRLSPLTDATNKHLLPVGRKPMIYHGIEQFVAAGIAEIMVVTSKSHMGDVVSCLGSGEAFGCELTYRVQENALGIAHALSLAEAFSSGQPLCVLLGDNIFGGSIQAWVGEFRAQPAGARVVLKEVADPSRFGIAALDERQIIAIEEKPSAPKSNYAVVGLYFFDAQVFDIIREIEPSARNELEITSVNNAYIRRGQLQYSICGIPWTDAGTFESLQEANRIVFALSEPTPLPAREGPDA